MLLAFERGFLAGSPTMLEYFGGFFYQLGLGVWIGAIVLLSFVVAPTLFRTLGPKVSSPFTRKLFPRYYLLCEICAAMVALGWALSVLGLSFAFDRWIIPWYDLPFIVVATVIAAWSRRVLTPALQRTRDEIDAGGASPETEALAKRLHKMAVRANSAMLFALLFTYLIGARHSVAFPVFVDVP